MRAQECFGLLRLGWRRPGFGRDVLLYRGGMRCKIWNCFLEQLAVLLQPADGDESQDNRARDHAVDSKRCKVVPGNIAQQPANGQ